MRLPLVFALLTACASMPGRGPWEANALKHQAAVDLACPADQVSTYDAGRGVFTARGCAKRCTYVRRSCNRVTRECIFVPTAAVTADVTAR